MGAYRRIYVGALSGRVTQFLNANIAMGTFSALGSSVLVYKYQTEHGKWTWRQTCSVAFGASMVGISVLAKRTVGRTYVLSIDKLPIKSTAPQSYRATFYGKEKLTFSSSELYAPSEKELGPFTSFLINQRKVFVNSDDMSYFEYREMLQDAVKPTIEDFRAATDDQFKDLLKEMDDHKRKKNQENNRSNG